MPQRTATIESLPMAFEVVKAMQADGLEWGEGYRPLGRKVLTEVIQGQMTEAVDRWLDSLDGLAMRDRRNGYYSRQLLSELGDIELSVPRTRRFCPTAVLKSYARRAPEIDRAILAGFVLGLSTRKVGEVLLALLGRKVSASTVSRVAKTLDAAVAAFLPILSKDDIDTKAIDEFPNGAGSYQFISRDGPTTILHANPDYLLGKPEIEEVVYQFVPDASTRLVSLISGELDIIERVEPEQYETLLEEDVTTSRTVSTENKYLHFRCYEPPFDDVRLRHAAAHAIDRDLILELMGPAGHPTVGQLSSVKFGYTDSIPNSPEYNPERCQELLAEAGYPGGEGLPPIEYLTSQGFYPKTKEYGEVITALLQEQGFPVQLTVMEVASWIERVLTRDETAPQLADTGWMTGSPEPNLVLRPMWHSDGLILTNCGSDKVDAAIEKQQTITDVDARRASIQTELMPALAEHLPSFGLFTSVLIHAHHPAIEGIYFLPNGPVDKVKATLKS